MRSIFKALAVCTMMCAASLFGQDITGSITGSVRDASGAAVAGAKVQITNTDRSALVREVTSDNDGNYSGTLLDPGHYSVSVEAKGFKRAVARSITLNVNDRLTENFRLEVGEVQQEVTVEASPTQVQLQAGAEQSTTINGTQMRELALVTRNYEQLVALMPGVSQNSVDQLYVGTTLPSGTANTIPFAINGARNSMNAWLVDGADNVDRGSNLTLLNTPSIDAIDEFKVQRSGYSADLGRAGGAQISVVTKSGTSRIHGDLYEFNRNNDLAANNFINNASKLNLGSDGTAKVAPLHYNDFGWTLGGPIFIPGRYNKDKNKTFFFFSEEFRRYITYTSGVATVPSQQELGGVFPHAVCVGLSGTTCTGTSTTIANIDPIAKEYIKDIYSKVALPATGNTLTSLFRNVFNYEQELYKVDHVFSPKLAVSARFLRDQIPTTEPQGVFSLGEAIPGIGVTNTNAPGRNWAFRAISAFTPTWLNEAGYDFSYGAILSDPTGLINSQASPDIKTNLAFPVTLSLVPAVTLSGGTGLVGFGPYRDYNRNHNIFDNMTKIHGPHTLRMGLSYNHYQKTENAASGNQGAFAFAPIAPLQAPATSFEQSFANFLQGQVSTYSQSSIDVTPDVRAQQMELYLQDDWKIKPNLTLNLGVRYSLFLQPYDAKNELTNFDPALFDRTKIPSITAGGLLSIPAQSYLNGIIINGQNSPWGSKVSNTDASNFAPRFGFAWDPFKTGKTSIRGGYGIFYDATLYGTFEQNIFANPPFVNSVSIPGVTLDNPTGGTATVSNTPKALRGTPTDFKTPYTQQWSLEVQRQMLHNTLFSVAYVGTKGTHLLGIVDLNQLPPNFAYTSGFAPTTTNYTSSTAETPLNAIRPYPGYNAINVIEPWFNSNYNALQFYATKRFSQNTQFSASYTWSRNLTDNGSDRSNAPENTYNFNRGEYGPASFDRTHVFNVNFVYDLPFYKDQKGLIGKALGGWEASAIGSYYTGLPFTVTTSSSDPAALGLIGSSASSGRPDLVCDPYANWTSTRTDWFNRACFINPAAGDHHVGDEGRGVLRGPGYEGWSIRLAKNLTFGPEQRYRFQLIGEAANAFNHTNPSSFGSLNNTSSTALFGAITGYRDPRIMQIGAKLYF